MSQLTPQVDPNEPPELPRDFREYKPIQPRGTDWRELGRKIWAPFAAVGAFLAKFGVGILKYKFLLGLFISFGAYLWYGGIWFAVGLVGLIFIHEMGHFLGHGHVKCGQAGTPAPVMQRQTFGLEGCTRNSWPFPDQRNYVTGPYTA